MLDIKTRVTQPLDRTRLNDSCNRARPAYDSGTVLNINKRGAAADAGTAQGRPAARPQPVQAAREAQTVQPRPSGTAYGANTQPRPSGTVYGAGAQPRPSGTVYGANTQPRPSGTAYGAAAQPHPSGTAYGAAAQPHPSGTAHGAGAQPHPSGTVYGAAAQPRPSGTVYGANTQPRPSGTTYGAGAQPRPSGTAHGAGAQPQPAAPFRMPPLKKPVMTGQKSPVYTPGGAGRRVRVCVGWNVADARCDVDMSVFLTGADGKVPGDEWFVFYGQPDSPDRAVHFGEDASGTDREIVEIDFSRVNAVLSRMVFVLTINEALERHLNFGMVRDIYLRILDAEAGGELLSYRLTAAYDAVTSLTLGELYLRGGQWKFNPIGNGIHKDLAGQCAVYGVQIM